MLSADTRSPPRPFFQRPLYTPCRTVCHYLFSLLFHIECRSFPPSRPHTSILDHRKSKRISEKHLLLLYWLGQSLWLCRSQQTGKCLKIWEYQTTWPPFWEICMQVKKQQLELDMEQQTGSKSGKEYIKAVYCHPAYWTSMPSTSCEMLGWMKHKLESRVLGEISITSDMQMTPPLWQTVKKNWKASRWKWKRRVKKLA